MNKHSNLDKFWYCMKNTPPNQADRCLQVLWTGRLPTGMQMPIPPPEEEPKEEEGFPWIWVIGGAALWYFLGRRR